MLLKDLKKLIQNNNNLLSKSVLFTVQGQYRMEDSLKIGRQSTTVIFTRITYKFPLCKMIKKSLEMTPHVMESEEFHCLQGCLLNQRLPRSHQCHN